MKKEQKLEQQPNSDSIADNLQFSPTCPKPIVSGWVSVDDRLPETLETVWVSDGKGWTTLGCRSDYYEGDDGKLHWCWAALLSGNIEEEGGVIVGDFIEDDWNVRFWHTVPLPPIR